MSKNRHPIPNRRSFNFVDIRTNHPSLLGKEIPVQLPFLYQSIVQLGVTTGKEALSVLSIWMGTAQTALGCYSKEY